ncbi:MAG: methylamine utilization protein MauG [Alphaproteobacteria bacterium]|nr:methylamine utilization protein MauG [Alphaproteobacteria bacterium]
MARIFGYRAALRGAALSIAAVLASGGAIAAQDPSPTLKQLLFPQSAVTPVKGTVQELGSRLFNDQTLSLNSNQACESCHNASYARHPVTGKRITVAKGFVDNDNIENGTAVSDGSVPGLFGSLNAPMVVYAAFSPAFHWDEEEGLYIGGQFWNGRASNLAEQAAQPFLNPVEMAMPSKWAVVTRLKQKPRYINDFKKFFGIDLRKIASNELAPASAAAPPLVDVAYAAMTDAIASFEKLRMFTKFNSKFDFVLAGYTSFTPLEAEGEQIFNGKAMCNACHISDPDVAPDGSLMPPMFTDFTYDNIGVPRNVNIPGDPAPNLGLGGRADVAAADPNGDEIGKHKVMTLRNIAVTAPYAHNGAFRTLEQITHFYNTRDVLGHVADVNDPGFGVTGWPDPEVLPNVNHDELGDLGLTPHEEAAVVAFMRTLTDDYDQWGKDPKVPKGMLSPFATTPFPAFP